MVAINYEEKRKQEEEEESIFLGIQSMLSKMMKECVNGHVCKGENAS